MGHGRDRVGSHNIILHTFTNPLIFILTANPRRVPWLRRFPTLSQQNGKPFHDSLTASCSQISQRLELLGVLLLVLTMAEEFVWDVRQVLDDLIGE